MHIWSKKAACIVALTFPMFATADVTMTVSSTPLQYTVTDLAPDDGIEAGLLGGVYRSRLAGNTNGTPPFYVESEVAAPVAHSLSAAFAWGTLPWGTLAAHAAGAPGDFRHSLSTATRFPDGIDYVRGADGIVSQDNDFVLAPHTRLAVTGLVTLTADIRTAGWDSIGSYYLNLTCMEDLSSKDCGTVRESFFAPEQYQREYTIDFVLENTSDQAIGAGIHMKSYLSISDPVPAVPEPATVLMLAGGLPLAAWAGRRRKSRNGR